MIYIIFYIVYKRYFLEEKFYLCSQDLGKLFQPNKSTKLFYFWKKKIKINY
jgi:hypothetical protein